MLSHWCRLFQVRLCPPVPQAVQPLPLELCPCAGPVAAPEPVLALAGAAQGSGAQGPAPGALTGTAPGAVLGAALGVPWPELVLVLLTVLIDRPMQAGRGLPGMPAVVLGS